MNIIHIVDSNDLPMPNILSSAERLGGVHHVIVVFPPAAGARQKGTFFAPTKIRTDVIELTSPTAGNLCSVLFAIDDIDSNEELTIIEGSIVLHPDVRNMIVDARSLGMSAAVLPLNLGTVTWFRSGREFVTAATTVMEIGVTSKVSYSISEAVHVLHTMDKRIYFADHPASPIILP